MIKMVAVASPDYLARRGTPLTRVTCTAMTASTATSGGWHGPTAGSLRKGGDRIEVAAAGPLVTNHSDVGRVGVAGLGLLSTAFDRELLDGTLLR
jgi:hypothetical protein